MLEGMNDELFQFGLKAFITLLVVVDPLGVAPSFVALTSSMNAKDRSQTLLRAVLVALGVMLFFLIAGRWLLFYLGVTVDAFAISGGVLLFLTSLPMLFGLRPGLQAPEHEEYATAGEDIAIFPLAIPLLAGPGTITTVLLFTTQAAASLPHLAILALITAIVVLISWGVLYAADRIVTRLGEGKVRILTRVLGIVLAALAVQYVLNGITGYFHFLQQREF
jgi:multiple antibiotic resistance protein